MTITEDRTLVADLRATLRGDVIDRADARYDDARRVWNGLIDRHPLVVARCRDVTDVVAALAAARRHRPAVSIRGGGHQVAGSAVCDDGLVVDLSGMTTVSVDAAARTARVGAGARWTGDERPRQPCGGADRRRRYSRLHRVRCGSRAGIHCTAR